MSANPYASTYPSAYELRYFLEVAASLNVSRAAVRLGITQPALTHALKRLESSLGTPLFIREKTGMRLTRSGARFVSRAQSLLEQWDRLREDINEEERSVRGRFSIGCHPAVALYSLPEVLRNLMAKYPGLEFRLSHDLSRKITEEVIAFRTDIGVVVNPIAHPNLVIQELCRDEMTFWTAPGGLQDTLILEPDLLQSQSLVQRLAASKLKFSRTLTSSSLEVVAALTGAGCGIGILPERVALRDRSLKLKRLRADMPVFKDRICLIYHPELRSNLAARTILGEFASTKF